MATRPYGAGPYGAGTYSRDPGTVVVHEVGGATAISWQIVSSGGGAIITGIAARTQIAWSNRAFASLLLVSPQAISGISFSVVAAEHNLITWAPVAPCMPGTWQVVELPQFQAMAPR